MIIPLVGKLETVSHDIVRTYKDYFEKQCNATNLSHIIEAYVGRSDLGIVRELDPNKKKVRGPSFSKIFSCHSHSSYSKLVYFLPSVTHSKSVYDFNFVLRRPV